MRKNFWNSKRFLAMLLILTLVFGQTGVVSAVSVSDNSIDQNTISANTIEEIEPEGAYNGTPSKVIGLKGDYSSEVQIRWTNLTTENKLTASDGREIQIGYQIEENGNVLGVGIKSADGKYWIWDDNSYESGVLLNIGQSVSYRVRGLYYTINEDVVPSQYNVQSVGEWSEKYTYKRVADKAVTVVSGVKVQGKAQGTSKYIKATWNTVPEATAYECQMLKSDAPLTGLTAATWDEFWNRSGSTYNNFRTKYPSASLDYDGDNVYEPYWEYDFDESCRYYYVRVRAYTNIEGYTGTATYSAPASCDAVALMQTNAPKIENFKVQYGDGNTSVKLIWKPVNQYVYVYAYEASKFPQHYYYDLLNARGKKGGKGRIYSYSSQMDEGLKNTIDKKVKSYSFSGSAGEGDLTEFLEPGKKYYFVAHTYNDTYENTDRTAIFTVDGIAYTKYADVSPASAVVSATKKLDKPWVSAGADKTKITITMEEVDKMTTGFEIYRKSGKKYKKIATTTDRIYVDSKLKTGTKYQYKVRAYYYNKNTKKKVYSGYVYVTGETTTVKSINMIVKHKSKTSVTLKWTKVTGATKYEIYRTTMDSGNPFEYSKSNSADKKAKYVAVDDKYELIKTISKASTTSYTDKGLTQGGSYQYRIVAYYKVGKKTAYVADEASVEMALAAPSMKTSLSGTTAKYTWDKNKFASKYEIKYIVYDKYTNATSDWIKKSTTKTSISIKNVPDGGYVIARIRAVSKSKKYSEWSYDTRIYNGLSVPKNIKAKNVTKKNTLGQKVSAVKITWKKVSGAKYYKVYRSTKRGYYDKDTQQYQVDTGWNSPTQLIAKESNTDETNNVVYYDQYYGEQGSVVGTTAYDYAKLDTGVTYYYFVVAFGEKGTNIYSTFKCDESAYGSGKPANITYKGTITISSIKNSKKGQAVVKWNKMSGTKKYYVYRSTKKSSGYKLIGSTKKTSYTDKKVKKGKTYYYKIVAKGTNGLKADFNVTSSVKKIKIKK